MDDPYEYLTCVDIRLPWSQDKSPEEREQELKLISEWAVSYCSDNPTDWLPALDKNAKKSVSKSRKALSDRMKATDDGKVDESHFKLSQEDHDALKQEYKSLKNRDIFNHILVLYVQVPALLGRHSHNNVEKCAILFEKIETSGDVEKKYLLDFFGKYDYYFQP